MKITDLMSKEAIKIHGHASSKMDAIEQMVSLMYRQGNVSDKEVYKEAVIKRENLSTTRDGRWCCDSSCKNKCDYSSMYCRQ